MSRPERWLALLASLVVLSVSAAIGLNPGGRHSPDVQCTQLSRPLVGGPYYEDSTVVSQRKLVPLGLACTYDSPRDSVGPQTVEHTSLAATVVSGAAALATIVCFVLILRARHGP
jgi:hypothetical protein